jgi:hypothetical protein
MVCVRGEVDVITVHCRGKWRMKLRGGLELRLSTTARESVISIRF